MDYNNLLKLVLVLVVAYALFYPIFITIKTSPTVTKYSTSKIGGAENIQIGETVEVQVTRKYLFLTLPKYVGSVNVDIFNKLWCFSLFLATALAICKVIYRRKSS